MLRTVLLPSPRRLRHAAHGNMAPCSMWRGQIVRRAWYRTLRAQSIRQHLVYIDYLWHTRVNEIIEKTKHGDAIANRL